jgi:hypothetical protein
MFAPKVEELPLELAVQLERAVHQSVGQGSLSQALPLPAIRALGFLEPERPELEWVGSQPLERRCLAWETQPVARRIHPWAAWGALRRGWETWADWGSAGRAS